MKLTVILSTLLLASTTFAANCAQRTKAVQAHLSALAKHLAAGPELLSTKSNKHMAMVKEYMVNQYDDDSDVEYKWWVESVPVDSSEAGTARTKAAIDAIVGGAEGYFADSLSKEEKKAYLKKVTAAAEKLKRHGLKFGYDAKAQGWGGSPANNILLLDTECKKVHAIFIGILEG